MRQKQSIRPLCKFLVYVLGRNPGEFGVVLDHNGFVKIKTLLQVLSEEPGWKHVRRAQLNEILMMVRESPIELKSNLIRAVNRDYLLDRKPVQKLPKLLYAFIRRRGYSTALEKGLKPSGLNQVVLLSNRDLALRMGKRIDSDPVILTVHSQKAHNQGSIFYSADEILYLTDAITTGCFTGPPPPKQQKAGGNKEAEDAIKGPKTPGSFFPNIIEKTVRNDNRRRPKTRRNEVAWKRERKRLKRKKVRIDHDR